MRNFLSHNRPWLIIAVIVLAYLVLLVSAINFNKYLTSICIQNGYAGHTTLEETRVTYCYRVGEGGHLVTVPVSELEKSGGQ